MHLRRTGGHVLNGDVFVIPNDSTNIVRRIEKAADDLRKLDWRLYSLVVVPVSRIESESPVRTG